MLVRVRPSTERKRQVGRQRPPRRSASRAREARRRHRVRHGACDHPCFREGVVQRLDHECALGSLLDRRSEPTSPSRRVTASILRIREAATSGGSETRSGIPPTWRWCSPTAATAWPDLRAVPDRPPRVESVASDSTAFRVVEAIAAEPEGLDRLRTAHARTHARARARAWELGAARNRQLRIDLVATLVGSHSGKQGAAVVGRSRVRLSVRFAPPRGRPSGRRGTAGLAVAHLEITTAS